jgi:hypothetical protein
VRGRNVHGDIQRNETKRLEEKVRRNKVSYRERRRRQRRKKEKKK